MPVLDSVIIALLPYLVELIIAIIKAENDPTLESSDQKCDHVLKKIRDMIYADRAFSGYLDSDIDAAAKTQISTLVAKLNDSKIFKRGH